MRNLTITRRKSFVACLVTDQVYIRDEQANELTIDGVPCRWLGEIKNGQTQTFQIEEGEQQIFLIADKLSKNYCNATLTIPEGPEDVAYSGVHQAFFGSNPFRFDNVMLTPEEQAKQKKNQRTGIIVMVAAIVIGVLIGNLTSGRLFGGADPKDFVKEDFQITLTEDFEASTQDDFFAFYQSKSVMVFTIREDKALFGDILLPQYVELVQQANGRTDLQPNQAEGFVWFAYTDTPDEQEIYYLVACCESDDAFWIVNFATPASNQGKYEDTFLQWAQSIQVGENE